MPKNRPTPAPLPPPQKYYPKPYKGDVEFLLDVRQALGLLTAIGCVAIEWSMLEMLLSTYYAFLVFGDKPGKDWQADSIVVMAFEALPTWQTKCNLMRAAAEERLGSDLAKELSKILGAFESVQRRRNNIIHGRWFLSKEQPHKWIRKRGLLGPGEEWDNNSIFQVRDDIREAERMLNAFFKKAKESLKGSPYQTMLEQILASQYVAPTTQDQQDTSKS